MYYYIVYNTQDPETVESFNTLEEAFKALELLNSFQKFKTYELVVSPKNTCTINV